MTLSSLSVGSIGTNCYILYQEDTKDAVVIDPGDDAALVEARLRGLGLRVRAILLTHGHFDHGGDAARIRDTSGAPIYLDPADLELPSWLTHGLSGTLPYPENGVLELAGLRFTVLPTPGHTPGGVCLLCGGFLFSGDTLFAGSCGRTDLPGGSWRQLAESLRSLAELEGDYQVFPGHGDATTLAEERRSNPYMQMALGK